MSSWKYMAVLAVGGWLGLCNAWGQDQSTSPTPESPKASEATPTPKTSEAPAPETPASGSGKVLFSRSLDSSGAPAQDAKKPDSPQSASATASTRATAEEQNSLTFLAYDLDIRIAPMQESLAIRAKLTVRNDGERPLKRLALQLSSALKWEQIGSAGSGLNFTQHPIDSDADHTGVVNEAVVTLGHDLAPKEELKLDVLYSGQVALSAARLERIGAPASVGEKSDWDRVSPDFIGIRGFGNVVWYPVSAPPVLLGDGAKLFTEMGRQKLRQQQARMTMTVTAEYSAEMGAPTLAILDGTVVPVQPTAPPENSYPGVVKATLPESVVGFATPSLFLLARNKVEGNGIQVFVTPEDLVSAPAFTAAAGVATPIVQQWLGAKPGGPLTVVGLPDPADASAEEGAVFFTGIKATPDPKQLEDAMVHSLAHAYFHSSWEWLNEGVPQLLGTLWIEQVKGRQAALEALESARGSLALAEPGTPGEGSGEELIAAIDPVYYRAKAAYVLWMLRDLAGDAPLAAALTAYNSSDDADPQYFAHLLEKTSGKDLKWFFDAWVYHDRGLPDLSITGVFPSKSSVEKQWLVALDISNEGYAEAEVPVTLRSRDTTVTERLRIPARGKVSRRILISGIPTEVQVNDGTVPEIEESLHRRRLVIDAEPESPK